MRRPRTTADWWLYGFALLALMLFAAIVLTSIERRVMARDVEELRREIEDRPTAEPTGGAEIPIPEFAASPDWLFPIAPQDYMQLTSPFGYRVSPLLDVEMYHLGLDIASTWRAQVVAVADGFIPPDGHWPPPDEYWKGHPTYGGVILIEHENGVSTLYAHLSWTRVHQGDFVRAGEVIGRVGNTGESDGEHLHIEVLAPGADIEQGERLNPALYVEIPK